VDDVILKESSYFRSNGHTGMKFTGRALSMTPNAEGAMEKAIIAKAEHGLCHIEEKRKDNPCKCLREYQKLVAAIPEELGMDHELVMRIVNTNLSLVSKKNRVKEEAIQFRKDRIEQAVCDAETTAGDSVARWKALHTNMEALPKVVLMTPEEIDEHVASSPRLSKRRAALQRAHDRCTAPSDETASDP